MSLLVTDESDVYPTFLNPVCQFAFYAFYDLEVYIWVFFFEFPNDFRDPVDRAAQVGAYFDRAYLSAF